LDAAKLLLLHPEETVGDSLIAIEAAFSFTKHRFKKVLLLLLEKRKPSRKVLDWIIHKCLKAGRMKVAEIVMLKYGFPLNDVARRCGAMRAKAHRIKAKCLRLKGIVRALIVSLESTTSNTVYAEILLFLPLGRMVETSFGLEKLLNEVHKWPDLNDILISCS